MPKKSKLTLEKNPSHKFKTFQEVLFDYKTDPKEAKQNYLNKLGRSKFKKDELLVDLPDFIMRKDFEGGAEFIKTELEKRKITLEELTLTKAKKRLHTGKKLTHRASEKGTIYVPTGFSGRDYFIQLIFLQHKYKLWLTRGHSKLSRETRKEILGTSLALVVIAIKMDLPHHLTENFYERYMLSLDELRKD